MAIGRWETNYRYLEGESFYQISRMDFNFNTENLTSLIRYKDKAIAEKLAQKMNDAMNCATCPVNQGFAEGSVKLAGPCTRHNDWSECHKNCEF